jgi:hypothetical protein
MDMAHVLRFSGSLALFGWLWSAGLRRKKMRFPKRFFSLNAILALSGTLFLSPQRLIGQGTGDDFMFHAPRVTLSFNFGYGIPSAGSDLFDEVTGTYTLDKGDFHAPVLGGGLSFFLNDRMDVAFEFSYARSSSWSEYADFVGSDDLPIEQETQFTRVPLTLSFRYFLMDRGREIGTLSWIPATWSPYIGAGGGRMFYEFEQVGDFIDFGQEDWPIFYDNLLSEGWAWVGHLFGGLQWALSPLWVVTAEGRYSLAEADLDRPAFVGYEPIDLSGFQGTIGFGIRF